MSRAWLGAQTAKWIALLLFSSALVLYLATLAPGVAGDDAGEFQFVPYIFGLPHPTGYPLYILFGKLWTMIVPLGTIAYRMNLLSAIAAALAVALTFQTVLLVSERIAAGLIAAITLATNGWYWEHALVAGVRPVHAFLVALILLLAVNWLKARRRGSDGRRIQYWLALVVGLAIAHHRTIFFVLPALALFMLAVEPAMLRDFRRLGQLALLAVLPNISYLYLLVRGIWGDPFAQLPVSDLASWWTLISGSGETAGRFVFEPAALWQHGSELITLLSAQYSTVGLVIAVLGALALARRSRELLILYGLSFGLTFVLLAGLRMDAGIQNSFSTNLYQFVPPFIGFGSGLLLDLASNYSSVRAKLAANRTFSAAGVAACLWLVAVPGAQGVRAVNSATLAPSRAELAGIQAARLVEDSLPRLVPNAMVLGDWTQITAFWYYQYVYGMRSDVRFYYSVNNWKAIGLEEQRFGRPLYLTRKVPEMLGQKHLGMTGPMIHWAGAAQTEAEPAMQPLTAQFGDRMELLGYRQHLVETNGWLALRPYIVQLSLWWRASRPPDQNYSISLRLVNAEGRQVAQNDSLHPVLGLYPTSLWDAGEIVEDYYELRADPGDRSLAYNIEILVYWKDQTGQLHNLPISDSENDQLDLPALNVNP